MTQKVLLITAIAGLTYLTLTSNKGGTGASQGNRIGVPGVGTGTCGSPSCHTSGIGTTGVSFEVRKRFKPDSNAIVNSYHPDSLYTVHMFGSHPTLSKFGYQLMVIKFSDTSTAGTIMGFDSTKSQAVLVGGRTLLESKDTISKTGASLDVAFIWKAPSKNTSTVRFHAMVVASNADGTLAGDQPSPTGTYALAEALSVNNPGNQLQFTVFPNPVTDNLVIRSALSGNGKYNVSVTNVCGKVIHSDDNITSRGNNDYTINTTSWPGGMYFVTLAKDGEQKTITVVK